MKKILLLLVFLFPTFVAAGGGTYDPGDYVFPQALNVLGKTTLTYASTTALTANSLCLTSDLCITTWPAGIGTVTSIIQGSGMSFSVSPIIGVGTINCATASGSVFGCLTSSDWGLLHAATTTFSSPLTYTGGTNAVTILAASVSQTGSLSSSDFQLLHAATTTFTSPLVYTGATNAVTCPTCGGSGGADSFTHVSVYGQVTSATSTLIAHTGTPFSLVASSTVVFVNASTTNFSVFSGGNVWFSNLTGPASLAIDSTGHLYAAATTTAANPTGSTGAAAAVNGTAVTYMRSDAVPACTVATASVPGCLAAADFTTFTNKQATISVTTPLMLTGAALSFSGVATSSVLVGGRVVATTDTKNVYSVATSTITLGPAFSSSGTIGSNVGGSSGTLSSVTYERLPQYGTSTVAGTNGSLWVGTTTFMLDQVMGAETFNGIRCKTDQGTLNFQLGNGSASTTMLNASTTANFNAFTSNNAPSSGTFYITIGTPASSVRTVQCTLKITI